MTDTITEILANNLPVGLALLALALYVFYAAQAVKECEIKSDDAMRDLQQRTQEIKIMENNMANLEKRLASLETAVKDLQSDVKQILTLLIRGEK